MNIDIATTITADSMTQLTTTTRTASVAVATDTRNDTSININDDDNNNNNLNNIKPLQIHDQCHVQWHGADRNNNINNNNTSSSNVDNNSGITTTTTATTPTSDDTVIVSKSSYIYLPAVIVERRMARKKTRRTFHSTTMDAVTDTTSKNNNNNNNNNNSKRRRRGSANATIASSNDDIIPSIQDVTTTTTTTITNTTIKKDMYETLPADALEYYVHYTDHDRRLDEWVTLDRIQLNTLHRYNQPIKTAAAISTTTAGSNKTTADPEDNINTVTAATMTTLNMCSSNNDNDNDSTDEGGDGETYSDSGVATRLTRRHSSIQSTTNSNDGMTGSTFSANTATTATTTGQATLLTSESDHGGSVFSFRGGNWHAGTGSSNNADPALAAFEREHEETTKVKNIETIVMGSWLVAAWYYSPFSSEYSDVETLYVCEFCLSYMKKRKTFKKHRVECTCRQPPGLEIYRHEDISVYELDGKEHRAYCQKLCLLAKLFLDHKTLYYDVTPFYFYVVTKVDCHGAHIVGYFSKEKVSNEGYNLACILTFPQYQQAGYGKFIISLSYELTKREGKTGSPEKPLSDLGKVSYRSYWTHMLMHLFTNCDPNSTDITMNDMSQQTGIKTEDIISTLQSLDMIKVWKGQHVVYVQQSIIDDYMKLNKKFRLCQSEYLKWEPPHGRPNNDPL